jgi:uncharacterized protein YcbX
MLRKVCFLRNIFKSFSKQSGPYMSHSLLIHSLHIYPIKACKDIEAPHLYVGPRGFTSGQIGDRSWILVDKDNRLVSQRTFPQLAKVQVEFITNSQGIAEKIQASCDGFEPIVLDPASVGDEKQNIIIHRGEAIGHKAPDEVSRWFSRFLNCDIQVLHQKLEDIRLCNPHFAHNPGVDAVSFADGYPYLVVTTGTLAQLNSFLEQPVLMNRFRPNIVVNAPAETEYSWKHIKIRPDFDTSYLKNANL